MELKIYKRGQGKNTRLCSGFGWALISCIGCWRLYEILTASSAGIWVETMVPTVLFAGLTVLALWLLNKPSVADFLIAAEGEIKKVNWSSRKEITASTFIVIVVVVLMSILLGVADLFFLWFFNIVI